MSEDASDRRGFFRQFLKRVVDDTGTTTLEPVISWYDQSARGYTSVKVCTWDRPGLFTAISGALAAAGLNILSARVFSRRSAVLSAASRRASTRSSRRSSSCCGVSCAGRTR